jgi:cytochrome c-type biogenesis protein CcmE
VLRTEVLESGKVRNQLKFLVNEVKFEVAGDDAYVAKFRVEYERIDGDGALAPEDQAVIVEGYLGILKAIEAYLVANPSEYA